MPPALHNEYTSFKLIRWFLLWISLIEGCYLRESYLTKGF